MLILPWSSKLCGKLLTRSWSHLVGSHPSEQVSPSAGMRRWGGGPQHDQRVTFWVPNVTRCWQRVKKSNRIYFSWAESKSNVLAFAISILIQPPASQNSESQKTCNLPLPLFVWGRDKLESFFFFFLTSNSTTYFCNQRQGDSPFGK